jgi:hypothetical protein
MKHHPQDHKGTESNQVPYQVDGVKPRLWLRETGEVNPRVVEVPQVPLQEVVDSHGEPKKGDGTADAGFVPAPVREIIRLAVHKQGEEVRYR